MLRLEIILIEICRRKNLPTTQRRLRALAVYRHLCFLVFVFSFLFSPVIADSTDNHLPVISILVDDMGDDYQAGIAAILLQGDLGYSFLPNSPHSISLANIANVAGKEVLLHLPMEPVNENALGVDDLRLDMSEPEFIRHVEKKLSAIPMIIGVNNHKGSLLTQHPVHMAWLMSVIKTNENLFFIDSLTSVSSVAAQAATEAGIANATRNVFLDHHSSMRSIHENFEKLIRIAKKRGAALAIAHPRKNTLKYLDMRLARIVSDGVKLVPVSEYIYHEERIENRWQASLSPSLKASNSLGQKKF